MSGALVLALGVACTADEGGGSNLSAGGTAGEGGGNGETNDQSTSADSSSGDGAASSTFDGEGSESSGSAPSGDPQYPTPTPVDGAGSCPDGFFGPITFDGEGWACLPTCSEDDPPTCPKPATGDAEAQCATNPSSSGSPCTPEVPCEVEGEFCGNIGQGQMGCLLPPSHCLLRCDEGQSCPDDMMCSASSRICMYFA